VVGSFADAMVVQTIVSDCADMYIELAQNTSMTGQAISVGEWSSICLVIFQKLTLVLFQTLASISTICRRPCSAAAESLEPRPYGPHLCLT